MHLLCPKAKATVNRDKKENEKIQSCKPSNTKRGFDASHVKRTFRF